MFERFRNRAEAGKQMLEYSSGLSSGRKARRRAPHARRGFAQRRHVSVRSPRLVPESTSAAPAIVCRVSRSDSSCFNVNGGPGRVRMEVVARRSYRSQTEIATLSTNGLKVADSRLNRNARPRVDVSRSSPRKESIDATSKSIGN